jgi:transcriptional regulator with XRE-family HTH domain
VGTESQDIREMKRLLQYASNRKVGDALGVSRATVSQWSRGKDVSPARVLQVRELMLQTVGRRKRAAAPDLPGRLDEIETKLDQLIASQATVAEEAVERLTAVLSSEESEWVRVMRGALAGALAETARDEQLDDEPEAATDEAVEDEASTPLPPP